MIAFVVAAAVMAAIALGWIVVPLWRRHDAAGVDRSRANLAILRDQRTELESDLANGVVIGEQYEGAVADLDRRVLDESHAGDREAVTPARSGRMTVAMVVVALPIAAVALYVALGTPAALSPELARQQSEAAQKEAHNMTPEQLQEMVVRLAARLEKEPENGEGWAVLARTYYVMSKPQEAVKAYDRAVKALPDDANLWADYADAMGLVQSRSLAGKPLEFAERALAINPKQWKALALAGTAAFDRKDFRKAVEYWERAKESVPPASPFAQSIDGSIAQARDLGGLGPAKAAAAPGGDSGAVKSATPGATSRTGAGSSADAAADGATLVAGIVTLAPALAKAAQPEEALYIFARAAQGSRMPLALIRKQVKDLPVAFRLDDSMAMAPNIKLSDFGEVIVGARVAKSGNAAPQSGDLEALSPAVKVGTQGLALVIDRTIP